MIWRRKPYHSPSRHASLLLGGVRVDLQPLRRLLQVRLEEPALLLREKTRLLSGVHAEETAADTGGRSDEERGEQSNAVLRVNHLCLRDGLGTRLRALMCHT